MSSSPTPSHCRRAPGRKRSATSVRDSTFTSPRIPCGARTNPTTTSSLIDLEVDLGPIARRHDLEERPDRLRDPAATTDDLPDVRLGDLEVELREVAVLLLADDDLRGIVDEGARDVLEEGAHFARLRGRLRRHRAAFGTSLSGMPLRTRSERADAVGRAPLLIQWRGGRARAPRPARPPRAARGPAGPVYPAPPPGRPRVPRERSPPAGLPPPPGR